MATTAPPDVPVRSLQDILTALERHPEWRTALRQQLLGEELLELPALFAKFAAETTRRLDLLTQELEATNKRLHQVIADLATLKNDVGILKGAHAETKARADIAVIADELDLEYRRIVPGVELRRVARENGAALRDDEIKSFAASDIIAETIDAEGERTYLAVEASFTGDLHDAGRARRHAALMQRLTNKPCRAVIASARNRDRLGELIQSGEVAWHQPADPDPAGRLKTTPARYASEAVPLNDPRNRLQSPCTSPAGTTRAATPTRRATCAAEAWPQSRAPMDVFREDGSHLPGETDAGRKNVRQEQARHDVEP